MALSRDRSLTIAAKVGLGAEELSKPCEECLYPLLANFVHPWRLVFSSLLSEVDLDDIDKESQSEQEKRVAALRKWKTRDGHKANYGVLVKVVLDNGKVDQAELLCQLLALQPPSDDQSTELKKISTKLHEMPDSSSTVPCQRSPLSPRPSPTPPLSSTTPATEHFPPVSTSLEEEIERLDQEYTEIESLVLETIKQRNVPHKTMLKWIQVLPMTLKSQFSELLQRNAKPLCNASSVDELFMIVSPYWNSLHPTLLAHLIKKLADEKLRSRMKKYMDDLCKFRIRTQLGDFIEKWAGGVPPGFDEFVLELGEEWRERTVEDLEQFRIHLSRQQSIGGHMTYMKKVMPGSIFVELALPQCCFPLTFNKDTQKFLREEDVLGVYVGGLCILDLHQPDHEKQVSDSRSSDDDWESETEAGAVAIVGTTGLSDSETDQSSIYSYDEDAEYNDQIQSRPSDREMPAAGGTSDRTHVVESSSTFPSLSSTNLRFLSGVVSVISTPLSQSPRFQMTPLRRTGEVEIQIEMNTRYGASLKDIEIGLERCAQRHTDSEDQFLSESSCMFLVCGAVFNSLKRNALVNISYAQDKLSLLQDISRIGLKITRDGALEFFVNGHSLGIAAEAVYKLGWNKTICQGFWNARERNYYGLSDEQCKPVIYSPIVDYYPVLWLPPGENKATLIAGASQTEVLSLQQMCIDKVAETLCSPKDVQLLPLPDNMKEKITGVVFDPHIDFSCCYTRINYIPYYNERSSSDTIIDHVAYKNLMTTVR